MSCAQPPTHELIDAPTAPAIEAEIIRSQWLRLHQALGRSEGPPAVDGSYVWALVVRERDEVPSSSLTHTQYNNT